MAYRAFQIATQAIRHAAVQDLPNLAVVAGPNGVGKSSLLWALYQQRGTHAEPETQVAYVGPHRPWRRSTYGRYELSEVAPSFRTYLETEGIPGWRRIQPAGLQHVAAGTVRHPGGADEAFSFVKGAILKLNGRLEQLVHETWQSRGGEIPPGTVPDLFEPLRVGVTALLPHLEFRGIDQSNDQELRVVFTRRDENSTAEVEIDELSSGEKAAISLLLPQVEQNAERLLGAAPTDVVPTILIDEPELHLHPSLQVAVIDYFSGLAAAGTQQFLVTTHSPTIIDSLADGELFLLAPSSRLGDGDNQLIALGRDQQRLEAMRAITGSTHLLTRCRPMVFLEGEPPTAKQPVDQRLVEILIPEASGWVTVAAQGRAQAISAARQLREPAAEMLPGVPIFALVDADQGTEQDPDFAISWPVAMIENLLLDPDCIWAVLEPLRDAVGLTSRAHTEQRLREIAQGLAPDEIRLRVASASMPIATRLRIDTADDAETSVTDAREALEAKLAAITPERVAAEFQEATAAVEAILNEARELEAFRGKTILKEFYDTHAKHAGLSYKAFVYAVAREAAGTEALHARIRPAVVKVERYVPAELADHVEQAAQLIDDDASRSNATQLAQRVRASRTSFEAAEHDGTDLEKLRDAINDLSRRIADTDPTLAAQIRADGALIGIRSATPRPTGAGASEDSAGAEA